jgi:hypothetical protein
MILKKRRPLEGRLKGIQIHYSASWIGRVKYSYQFILWDTIFTVKKLSLSLR